MLGLVLSREPALTPSARARLRAHADAAEQWGQARHPELTRHDAEIDRAQAWSPAGDHTGHAIKEGR